MDPSDNPRRIESLIRLGLVEQVDLKARPSPLVRVRSGDLITNWTPYLQASAARVRSWNPPLKGQQVILLSPSGETGSGVAIGGLPIDAMPAPFDDPELFGHVADDGAIFTYNMKTHELTVKLPASGKAVLTGDLVINGQLEVSKSIKAAGEIASDADVKAGEISLKKHLHTSGAPGADTSPPKP